MTFISYDDFRKWYTKSNTNWNSEIDIEINNIMYHTPGDVFESFEE